MISQAFSNIPQMTKPFEPSWFLSRASWTCLKLLSSLCLIHGLDFFHFCRLGLFPCCLIVLDLIHNNWPSCISPLEISYGPEPGKGSAVTHAKSNPCLASIHPLLGPVKYPVHMLISLGAECHRQLQRAIVWWKNEWLYYS